jgi:hypothetical protein
MCETSPQPFSFVAREFDWIKSGILEFFTGFFGYASE